RGLHDGIRHAANRGRAEPTGLDEATDDEFSGDAMNRAFRDRAEAGRALADRLTEYAGKPDVLVLALPRGGVPVGFEVARTLGAPLDVFLVRKLGVPNHEELAMGAIAS